MAKRTYQSYITSNKRLIQNLRRILKAKDWSVERLAIASGLDKSNLYNMMNGKINFTLRTVEKAHDALEVDISELFRK